MSFTRLASTLFVLSMTATAAAQPVPEPVDPNAPPADPNAPPPPSEPAPTVLVEPVAPAPVIVEPTPVTIVTPQTAVERIGFSLTAGGGVSGFTNETLRGSTKDGGLWDVRAALGTKTPLTFEASYVGSAQSIDALGLSRSAVLLSNGLDGNLRLNFTNRLAIQPFVFAGVGWRRYEITNTNTNTSDINDEDNVIEVPAGLGFAVRSNGLLFDLRGEVRAAMDNDLMPSLTASSASDKAEMHRYGVNASLGYEF